MENEEQKQEPVQEEVVEQQAEAASEQVEQIDVEEKEDRPAINYAKELERKNRELEKARAELDAERGRQINRYDPNDLKTWSENDLKAIANSPDPAHLRFKEQAQDIILERKLERMRAADQAKEKRVMSELELRRSYPEALDPSSEFSLRMEEMIHQFDLDKSPAGRLAAAKLVAAEMRGAKAKSNAVGRKAEEIRRSSVKANFSDGDRPKSVANDEAQRDLEKRSKDGDEGAFMSLLKKRLPPLK